MNDNDRAPRSVDVGHFFDGLTDDYTRTIERCFPRYREMLWALLEYLPSDLAPNRILELGCGTGNLSQLLNDQFPAASIRLVDLSAESLSECKSRLPDDARLSYQHADFRDLEFPDDSFDLVISSISVHHLTGPEKRELFAGVRRWLAPGGVFAYCDQHAGSTEEIYRKHMRHWQQLSRAAGSTTEEWQMWMQHQADHDHHDALVDQIDWLREAGFESVDCPWRYLLWAVLIGRRGDTS